MHRYTLAFCLFALISVRTAEVGASNFSSNDEYYTPPQIQECDGVTTIPISCLYFRTQGNKITKAQKDLKCDCMYKADFKNPKYCEWNRIYRTNGSHFDNCQLGMFECGKPPQNRKLDPKYTKCFLADQNYPSFFPPHVVISRGLTLRSCDYGAMSDRRAPYDTEFYNHVFTCLLEDCGVRLRIPSTAMKGPSGYKWCLPPIMNEVSPIKYCKLYSTHVPTFNGYLTPYNELDYDETCVLPPPCGKDGRIDRSKYMVPLINGTWNDAYCERLCSLDPNKREEPCLHVPPCQNGTTQPEQWANRRLKLNECYPWCSEADSIIRDVYNRSVKACVPIPPCDTDGRPKLRSNRWRSVNCVKINNCTGNQRPESHICKAANDKDSKNDGPTSRPFGAPEIATVSLIGILITLTIVCGTGFVIHVILEDHKHEQTLMDKYSTQGLDWNNYSRLREGFCKENHLGSYNTNALRQALAMALKQASRIEEPEASQEEQS